MKIAKVFKKWDADRAKLNSKIRHLNNLEKEAAAKADPPMGARPEDRSDRNRRDSP